MKGVYFFMKRWTAILLACVFVMTLMAGCGGGDNEPVTTGEEIKIGAIFPLTGDVSTFGQSTLNSVMLATKEWNERGGIDGKMIKLVSEDDKNDPTESANAALKLINQDGVVALIGSVTSKCTLSVAPIAQQNGLPMITPTSTNEQVTEQGDFIFRSCFIDPFQGQVMAKFAWDELGAQKAAVLFDLSNDYTKGLAEAFQSAFTTLGGEIVASETYAFGDQDFNAQLTKIKGVEPDVLFLPDYYSTVGLIMKQARELGLEATFLGGDGWDSPELVPIAGDAAEGGYFSNHYSPESEDPVAVAFLQAYQAEYGAVPDALGSLAYDAAHLLFNAIDQADSTEPAAIRDALANTEGFHGVSGEYRFDENRNPIKSAAIITIKDGKQSFVGMVAP